MKLKLMIFLILINSYCIFLTGVYADTIIIRPSSQDSWIKEISPDSNAGTVYQMNVKTIGTLFEDRSIVRFDLSGIPPSVEISSATLYLWKQTGLDTSPAGRTYWAYQVTSDWTETGVTWNSRDGTNPWTTPGGDYTTVDGASTTVPASNYILMGWDVTEIVLNWWVDGDPNYGFLILDPTEDTVTSGVRFYTKENAGSEEDNVWPYLEIITTSPPPVGGEILPFNNLLLCAPYMIGILTVLLLIHLGRSYRARSYPS